MALSCLAGCAEPPRKEMDQAQGAIDAARAVGAAEYAATEFDAAVSALARAEEAVGQRDYRLALSQALDARERAQSAAREAANRQAEFRSQAEREAAALESAVQAATSRLDTLRDRKVPQPILAATTAAVAAAQQALQEARTRLAAQEFRLAAEALPAPAAQLASALSDLEQAVAALPPAPATRRRR
jgi:hypothetical protein